MKKIFISLFFLSIYFCSFAQHQDLTAAEISMMRRGGLKPLVSMAVEQKQTLEEITTSFKMMSSQVKALSTLGPIESLTGAIEILKNMMGETQGPLNQFLQHVLNLLGADEADGVLDTLQKYKNILNEDDDTSLTELFLRIQSLVGVEKSVITTLNALIKDMGGGDCLEDACSGIENMVGGESDHSVVSNLQSVLDLLGGAELSVMGRAQVIHQTLEGEGTILQKIQYLKDSTEDVSSLKQKIQALKEEKADLEDQVQILEKEKTSLERQVNRLTTDNSKLEKQAIDLKEQVASLKTENTSLEAQISSAVKMLGGKGNLEERLTMVSSVLGVSTDLSRQGKTMMSDIIEMLNSGVLITEDEIPEDVSNLYKLRAFLAEKMDKKVKKIKISL